MIEENIQDILLCAFFPLRVLLPANFLDSPLVVRRSSPSEQDEIICARNGLGRCLLGSLHADWSAASLKGLMPLRRGQDFLLASFSGKPTAYCAMLGHVRRMEA